MNKALVGWDITIPKKDYPDRNDLFKLLAEWCKKWAVQVELGEEKNYLHYQCRVSLFKRKRRDEIIEQSGLTGRWSPTTRGVHAKTKFNYVLKADTRVDGPWTDKDYEPKAPMTTQMKLFLEKERYPCWVEVEQKIQVWEERKVICISDKGLTGKSMFLEYLEYKGLAKRLPPVRNAQDLLRAVYDMKDARCYIIDIPRAMGREKLAGFYAGIETIKDGWCYDERYSFKARYIQPGRPNVVVFGNHEPDQSLLTRDRWDEYTIEDHELVKVDRDEFVIVGGERAGEDLWRPASGL